MITEKDQSGLDTRTPTPTTADLADIATELTSFCMVQYSSNCEFWQPLLLSFYFLRRISLSCY